MTAEQFAAMVAKYGLTLVDQFGSWGPGGEFKLTKKWDLISVLGK
jgi:hypothetical protein